MKIKIMKIMKIMKMMKMKMNERFLIVIHSHSHSHTHAHNDTHSDTSKHPYLHRLQSCVGLTGCGEHECQQDCVRL